MENQSSSTDPQIIAIVSYITFIGWIIAYVLYQNNKSELAIMHIRQALGIILIGFLGYSVSWFPFIGGFLGLVIAIAAFIFWIMGLIAAIQRETKPVPLIGDVIQDLFKGIQ
jgi:uncharacterized membrane protein